MQYKTAWTDADDRVLRRLWSMGVSDQDIATDLDRTLEAVRARRRTIRAVHANGQPDGPRDVGEALGADRSIEVEIRASSKRLSAACCDYWLTRGKIPPNGLADKRTRVWRVA